ncbi:MAG: hypothetical protein VX265_07145 [Myxococcota bacterium]|nr:hypothetical protein [Myxococcota bacterium]MEC8423602.1 hypothetical protein [Myxococcota bacterium]
MGQMIQKPDTNPVVVALCNLLLCGIPVGYFMIGQQKKAVMTFIGTLVLGFFGIGFIIPWITAYDAYLLGEKLQRGESIGMNENGLDFLDAIFKD